MWDPHVRAKRGLRTLVIMVPVMIVLGVIALNFPSIAPAIPALLIAYGLFGVFRGRKSREQG